jgi:hypothetical protein
VLGRRQVERHDDDDADHECAGDDHGDLGARG